MQEDKETTSTPTPPSIAKITSEAVDSYLTDNNFVRVSKADIATVKNGGSVSDKTLLGLQSSISERNHGKITKEERGKFEDHFSELTGISKNDGENVFDYTKRTVKSLKSSGSDNTELKEIIARQKKEVEELSKDIESYRNNEKQQGFNAKFSGVFDKSIKKYGEISPQLSKRLKKEFSNKIFADKSDIEGGTVYRKGTKVFDSSANNYTVESLIDAYMSEDGFEIATNKKTEKTGDLQDVNTAVKKDNQNKTSLFQQAQKQAYAEAEKKPMSTIKIQRRAKEILKSLQSSD